ncbi:MAG: NEAT domain-containing protein [Lachnospiraceae bacterium]
MTFEAKQEGSDEESMLAGYFDPKAKLTVENGKMYVTF